MHLAAHARRHREGGSVESVLSVDGWRVIKQMDQHTFIALPDSASDVQIGDIIAFGASHPCLTFDKWRHIHLVNAELAVIDTWETCF